MRDNAPPPPPGVPAANWTPGERRIWLISHKAPDNMMLVTKAEMQVMANSMGQQRKLTQEALDQVQALAFLLGDYYAREDGLPSAVKQAVFDAGRYKKATEVTAKRVQALKERCARLADSARARGHEEIAAGVVGIENELAERLIFLVEQMALKLEE